MSVPESIAWLETSRDSQSPSAAQIYATTIIGELERLSQALESCAHEVDNLERLRHDAVSAHRALETTFASVEEKTRIGREQWDRDRTDLTTRLEKTKERLAEAEGVLKDVHYGLLKQPELTRKDLAHAIESVVTPYAEGEMP